MTVNTIFDVQKKHMKWSHIGFEDDLYERILRYGKENGIKTFTGSLIYAVIQYFKYIGFK